MPRMQPGNGFLRLFRPHESPDAIVTVEVRGVSREILNQEPMTLEELREEARYACDLLRMFEAIRSNNVAALRDRIVYSRRGANRTRVAEIFAGGEPTWTDFPGEGPLPDDGVLSWCRIALGGCIGREIGGFTPVFTPDGNIALRCPDLQPAMYWQFACLMQGKKPIVTCKGCKNPLVQRRPNHWHHNSSCRSRRSRQNAPR